MADQNTVEKDRVRFIEHKGKSILLQDYSNLRPGPEFYELVDIAQKLIAAQPPKSVLSLVDATQSVFDAGVLVALKRFAQANTPYMKFTAAVGITGLKEVGLMAVSKAAGRPFETFDNRESALDFLAELD
jgi:hypothetical protein